MQINLALDQMGARLNHERRVAFPFYRDDRKVALLQFEPVGPVIRELPADSYDRNYKVKVEQSVETVALKLIGASRTCYLPGSRVLPILLEIFNMTQTNGTGNLDSLSQAELTETYNKLAEAAKKGTVKGFKSKAEAIARIQKLQEDVIAPTPVQQKAAAEAEAKAAAAVAKKPKAPAKVAANANVAASEKKAKAEPKNLGQHVAAKKAAKAKTQKSETGEKKPRGSGIGQFCMDLIKKGKSNEEVLAAVKVKFPDAATSSSSVAWYRNKLKSEGELPA